MLTACATPDPEPRKYDTVHDRDVRHEGYEAGYLQALRDCRQAVINLEGYPFELTNFLNELRARIEQREGT